MMWEERGERQRDGEREGQKEEKERRGRKRECQMQVCFVARLSQRECVGNVVKCA